MEDDLKKEYELAVLVNDETAEAAINESLSGGDVEIINKEPAKMLHLAYPIKKHNSATLFVYQFRAVPDKIDKIKESLRFQPNILRTLLITSPVKELRPEAVATAIVPTSPKPSGSEISSNELLTKTLEKLEDES